MFRKTTSLLLIALMMVLLATGCAASPAAPVAEATPATEAAPAEGGKIRIGLAMPASDQYFSGVQQQLEKIVAEKADSIEIVATYEADYDVQKQLEQVATLATLDVDVIVGAIVDTNNAEAVFDKANGIPMVWISRHPETSVLEKYPNVFFAGSPEKDAGLQQGAWLAEYFKAKGVDTINYVLFMGPLGLENVNMRTLGAKEALEKAGFNLVKVFEDTAEWDRAEAMSKMQQVLAMGKQIDCVICNNDEMALGAIEAMKAAGQLEGIPVVGVDATTNGMTSVKSGEMAMTVLQNAVGQAQAAIAITEQIANGETPEKETWIPFEPVTSENVDEYMASLAY